MSILERFKFRDNSKNYPGWENQDYIHYLNQSADDTTVEKRRETLAKAEALLIEEMPLAPIYHWKGSFMIKDHLTYEEIAPMGAFDYARITVKNELR
jgi:oligopeptide transport system substrate-binding protein